MGCGASKIDTEIVELCRERKKLIKAARDSWYSLASAHLAYFESLLGVQSQLKSFTEESVVVCFNPVSNTGLEDEFGDLTLEGTLGNENVELNEDLATWDLQKVFNEINAAFVEIIMDGEDVSMMFGPYQPEIALGIGSSFCTKFSAASSRVASCLDCGMLRGSARRRLKIESSSSQNNQNEINMTRGSLSLTLEKLCMLESKLYQEIKDEEKLRKNFDRAWRKLKKLSDTGAESSEMDASHGSLKRLTPRITVAISVVEGIATRTHQMRDGELLLQLSGLIERLHGMWEKVLKGHKKQVHALTIALANAAITCSSSDSSLRAVQILEAAVTMLGKAFFEWTESQKAFADLLTKWLMKFVPDNSSDPSSSLAPQLLAICNRWSSALMQIPAAQVLQPLNSFSLLLQLLRLKLHEERQQTLKIEYLSSHHEKVVKKACSESGVDWDEYAAFIAEAAADTSSSASIIEPRFSWLHEQYLSLSPIRLKLREEQARHTKVRGELEAAAPNLIREGLAPAFKALEIFSFEMANALGQVLVPNEQGRQSQ